MSEERAMRDAALQDCDHDWNMGPTMDMNPPILSRFCRRCGLGQSSQDPPFGDGKWHTAPAPEQIPAEVPQDDEEDFKIDRNRMEWTLKGTLYGLEPGESVVVTPKPEKALRIAEAATGLPQNTGAPPVQARERWEALIAIRELLRSPSGPTQ